MMKNGKEIPMIKIDHGIPTLYVNGAPFIAKSGEIHNSSSVSLEYMKEHVWPYLNSLHMNAVIVPVYWELIEAVEGEYEFALVDGLIRQAREHEMKLIFLWFGLWKNAESVYVPQWMKQDMVTYFRAQTAHGERLNTISPFCQLAIEKDATAFAHLMAHIREVNEKDSTVIMMQVENEVGLLGTARDYCWAAEEAFMGNVPADLLEAYEMRNKKCSIQSQWGNRCGAGQRGSSITKKHVSLPTVAVPTVPAVTPWKEAFGEDAEEIFMAYYMAHAIEQITAAGQKEYPLPCYANSWLKQYPWYPGSYPSGGPVTDMHWVWKVVAPSLFTLAPDIYVPYVSKVMEEYSYEGNPLVIPEVRKDAVTASYALYAFLHHNAICYGPFGVEELGMPREEVTEFGEELMHQLNINPLAFDMTGSKEALRGVYELVENLQPLYLRYRGTPHLQAYLKKDATDSGAYLRFTEYDMEIAYYPSAKGCPDSAGAIFELAENKFLLVGMMSQVKFHAKTGENPMVGYLSREEGCMKDGQWQAIQHQNGDEKYMMMFPQLPACYMVELYKY